MLKRILITTLIVEIPALMVFYKSPTENFLKGMDGLMSKNPRCGVFFFFFDVVIKFCFLMLNFFGRFLGFKKIVCFTWPPRTAKQLTSHCAHLDPGTY